MLPCGSTYVCVQISLTTIHTMATRYPYNPMYMIYPIVNTKDDFVERLH